MTDETRTPQTPRASGGRTPQGYEYRWGLVTNDPDSNSGMIGPQDRDQGRLSYEFNLEMSFPETICFGV
jgi:hypothetical protein